MTSIPPRSIGGRPLLEAAHPRRGARAQGLSWGHLRVVSDDGTSELGVSSDSDDLFPGPAPAA